MVVAFTGFSFEWNIHNSGEGIKIDLFRCQAGRVVKRAVKTSRIDENGARKYNGEVVRNKGDIYMIDCNITGLSEESLSNPKFSLMKLFHSITFPKIATLVGDGGQFEGYIPVVQVDNAGPHQDSEFEQYCSSRCKTNNWK